MPPTVVPSTLIGTETTPTKEQLWDLAFLLTENWTNFVRVTNSFATDVRRAKSLSEHRWGLLQAPERVVSSRAMVHGQEAAKTVRSFQMRGAISRSLVPIWSDLSDMTDAPSGATNIKCDTRYRRFADGQRIALVRLKDGQVDSFEVVDIVSFTDTDITTSAHAHPFYKKGDLVYPLIEARLELVQDYTIRTDNVITVRVEAKEDIGPMRIPIAGTIGANPPNFGVYDSLPVFDIVPDQRAMSASIFREGSFAKVGRGYVLEVFGARGQQRFDIKHIQLNRKDAWDLIQFFESRAGSLYPFWFISPTADMNATAVVAGQLDVDAVGPELDWDFVTHVAIVMKDGTYQIRGVTSVTRNGGTDEITPDAVFSPVPALADILRVSFAYKVRFDSDEMSEDWKTNTIMESQFKMIELLDEKDITIANLTNTLNEATGELGETPLQFPGGILFPGFTYDNPFRDNNPPPTFSNPAILTFICDREMFVKFLDFAYTSGTVTITNITRGESRSVSVTSSPFTNLSGRGNFSADPLKINPGDKITIEFSSADSTGQAGLAHTGAGWNHHPFIEVNNKTRERWAQQRIIATDTADVLNFLPGMSNWFASNATRNFATNLKLGVKFTPPFPKMTVSAVYAFFGVGFTTDNIIDIKAEVQRVSDSAIIATGRLRLFSSITSSQLDYATSGLCAIQLNSHVDLVSTESYRAYFYKQAGHGAEGSVLKWISLVEGTAEFDTLLPFGASNFIPQRDASGAGWVNDNADFKSVYLMGVVATRLFLV